MKTRSRIWRTLPALAMLVTATMNARAQEAPPPVEAADAADADLESLGKAAERFVEAFNKKDAAALAALFLPTGEIIRREGEAIHGREEIEAYYKEIFEGEEVPQVALEASSVRLVAPGVAIEDGVVHFSKGGEEDEVKSIRYSATQIKQADGTWLVASTRDEEEVTPSSEHIKPLLGLAGEWSFENDGLRMELALDLDESGNFLLGEAVTTDPEGDQQSTSLRIGWNPACSSLYWWTFDSDGGNASGQWTRSDEGWLIRSSGVTADAEINAATQRLKMDGGDTLVWSSTDRVMAGEAQPDVELRFVRRAPDAGGSEEEAAAPEEEAPAEDK